MDLSSLLYLTGLSGFFTSRAFVPAFCTAFFLRYGQYLPWIGNIDFIQATGAEPTWFTSNLTIGLLGLLSLLEIGATKFPEAQELLDGVHKYAKTGLAAVSALGVLGARDAAFIEQTISQAGTFDMVVSGALAVVVYVLSTLRSAFMGILNLSDPDDDLGIQTLVSWFEDIWSSFGVFLLILYPLFILTVLGIIVVLLMASSKYARYREERSKVPCGTCGEYIYACAVSCPKCHTPVPNPKDVGFFSQTVDRPAASQHDHELRLVSKRRCQKCASRIEERKLPQMCPVCKNTILGSTSDQEDYIGKVRDRLPKVLGVSFLLSMVPVIGVIPGIIYYRIQLISPFRAYIPAGKGLALRWMLKLLFIFLIALQVIPGLGAFMVPIMALISYTVYSGYFKSLLGA